MRMSRLAPLMAVLLLGGCGLFNSNSGPLVPDANSPIKDVPVPAGFAMKGDSTSQVIAGKLRMVNHHYTGGDDWLQVVAFYKAHMASPWAFVDQTQLAGQEIMLHFANATEDCRVTVSKGTFDTTIRVKIDPITK
jgi:hypothetical protein